MKNVAQITQDELIQLIAEKISADGFKVIPADYEIEFVTSPTGKTSALITGIVKDPDVDEAVPEQPSMLAPHPVTSVISPAKDVALEDIPIGLERSTRVALQVALTFKPQTQKKLVKKVLEALVQQVPADDAEPSSAMKRQVNGLVITALQAWVEEGKLVYVEDLDAWHKKRAPKSSAAQAASDVLGGSGGVMDRGDALGAGVADDRRRTS